MSYSGPNKVFNKASFWIGLLAICLLLGCYWYLAWERHITYPDDRLLPLPSQLWDGLLWSLTPEGNGAKIPLIEDILASLMRLLVGLGGAITIAFGLTLCMYVFERFRYFVLPIIIVMAKIPPIALLPILLLWLGLNESAKAALLIIGITPSMVLVLSYQLNRDSQKIRDKLLSLQLPRWQQLYFIHLPMLWPTFLQLVQTNLGAAWLFLLVGETFGADAGLGYRIFVVRRYLAMDIILVYVAWITLLSTLLYMAIGGLRKRYQWTLA